MKLYGSLKSALTLSFVLAAALPIFVIGIIALQSLSISMEEEITNKNFLLAKTLASESDRFLEAPMNFLKQTKEIIQKQGLTKADWINSYLASAIKTYKFFDTIMILDQEGMIRYIAPDSDDFIGMDMSGYIFFRRTNDPRKPYCSTTFISMQTGQATLTMSLPLMEGMLVGYLNLTVLNSVTDKIKIGSKGYAAITDQDGTFIAHPNRSFVLTRINLKNIDLVSQGFTNMEGNFRYHFRGEDTLISIAVVANTYWMVVVIQPVEEAFDQVRKLRNFIWIGTLAAIAIAIMMALSGLKKTLKPLLQLTEDSKRIAGGDYSYDLRSAEYREIDNLQNSFKAMIDAIRAREEALHGAHDRLEQRVEERTIQLKKTRDAADAANRAKSDFLANMSHELRTPLGVILGFSQLMNQSQDLSQEHRESLEIIRRNGEHLLSLINDVLDMSKIEAGRLTLNEQHFDLYHLLDDMENMFRPRAEEKGLQLVFARVPELARQVRTDETKLRQVLINLLNNAIKFTKKGSVSVVSEQLQGIKDNELLPLRFEVRDTGPGIDPEELDEVFEAFAQTKTGRDAQEGTGLGLPISRRFAQLMGGDLTVSSETGQGSVFQFDIHARASKADDIPASGPVRRVVALEPGQPCFRILLVDDKQDNRALLIKLLDPLGFEIHEAENGQEAVRRWESQRPHLIWMDMRMPVMN